MVKPVVETPSGSLWLSSLDLVSHLSYHAHTVFYYRPAGAGNFFDATVLKAALSRALLHFYPYAGRLKWDQNDFIEVDCNGDGMLFVEAECDGAKDELGDFTPTPELSLTPAADYSQGLSAFLLSLFQRRIVRSATEHQQMRLLPHNLQQKIDNDEFRFAHLLPPPPPMSSDPFH